jgi:hypothetical protein
MSEPIYEQMVWERIVEQEEPPEPSDPDDWYEDYPLADPEEG